MITVQIQTVRSAEVTISPAGPFVTLRCGGYDRVVIHTRNDTDARALAAIFNGALQQEGPHAYASAPAGEMEGIGE